MTIKYHSDFIQGSDEWVAIRCGLLTASEMWRILTPTLRPARNDKSRGHLWRLLAQRLTRRVEAHYISDDMLRGQDDEVVARELYAQHYAPVEQVGFVTNNKWGFTIGYSPDGLVGADGLVECKSRESRFQVETIVEHVAAGTVPTEFMLQLQTALLVTERCWIDLVSYCGGLPMAPIRVCPDDAVLAAIVEAATAFEASLAENLARYHAVVAAPEFRLTPTERHVEQEMFI